MHSALVPILVGNTDVSSVIGALRSERALITESSDFFGVGDESSAGAVFAAASSIASAVFAAASSSGDFEAIFVLKRMRWRACSTCQ